MRASPSPFAPSASSPFAVEVREAVRAHFAAQGTSEKASTSYTLRALTMLALVVGPYVVLLQGIVPLWGALLLSVVVGVGVAGMGFGVSHDALHGSASRRVWVNFLLSLSFPLLGASGYLWRLLHNRVHHTFTNMHPHDEDLEASPLLRLTPEHPRRAVHRWQHLYAWPMYALTTLNWAVLKDFQYMLRRNLGPVTPGPHALKDWAGLLLGKALHFGWTVVLPIVLLQPVWWHFVLCFLAMHLTAGFLLAIVFQLAHVVEQTAFVQSERADAEPESWAVHQLRTTCNFARGRRLLTWFVGGLNHQVEHHLFPQVNSTHYRTLAPIVEACARRHGVPYHAAPSFFSAVRSHARTLRRLGRPTAA